MSRWRSRRAGSFTRQCAQLFLAHRFNKTTNPQKEGEQNEDVETTDPKSTVLLESRRQRTQFVWVRHDGLDAQHNFNPRAASTGLGFHLGK
jgi:hypothetical protein